MTVTPDVVFSVDVNALLSYLHVCVTPSAPPLQWLEFLSNDSNKH